MNQILGQPNLSLLTIIDSARLEATAKLDPSGRSSFGQFLTPLPTAKLMSSMFGELGDDVRILDPGAGIGTLFTAAIEELCGRKSPPKTIHVVAYEIDAELLPYLRRTARICEHYCQSIGIRFTSEIRSCDFIADAADRLGDGLFSRTGGSEFDLAILNPPYRKISSNSQWRHLTKTFGPDVVNLYAAFLAASIKFLKNGGQMVSITPRSFCNGPYFRNFRMYFLRYMRLSRFHMFASRDKAFKDDAVLQETIISHAIREVAPSIYPIEITASDCPDGDVLRRTSSISEVVNPDDPQVFFHLASDGLEAITAARAARFTCTLSDLGIAVSTGKVVDFRVKNHLRDEQSSDTVPLIYPGNLSAGQVSWPKTLRKPQAMVLTSDTLPLTVASGTYVLVKRFSSKEEKKRITAGIFEPTMVPNERVAFENHLNFYHSNGNGLKPAVAKGLALFLNSTQVDDHFRQFNGHTQVNATDLRALRYPSEEELIRLGARLTTSWPSQEEIDQIMSEELMKGNSDMNPQDAKIRIAEAIRILTDLGMPRAQINERSALTLLALLDLKPDEPWTEASAIHIGITPMMEFMKAEYGKDYAPNTRETVRRQTVHQFMEAGLVVENPDDPLRAINSPKTVYGMEASALALLQQYGAPNWSALVKEYLADSQTLQAKYRQTREKRRIPLELPENKSITLSPGDHSALIAKIVEEFAPMFTPGGKPLYIGDTGKKYAYYDKEYLGTLGVQIRARGKMPDVVIHHVEQDWLVLVEAVTSHGPIDPKRQSELKHLFREAKCGLVFVTAFLTRSAMRRYLSEIAWETEVWAADAPEHIIHFNGERFLGPY